MLEALRTDQIICGQVGRADADDVAIAPVVVDIVRPSAPGAASGYVNDFNRYVDERPFRERLGDRASYTIEAASRGRSGNNLYQSIGLPDLAHVAHLFHGRSAFTRTVLAAIRQAFVRATSLTIWIASRSGLHIRPPSTFAQRATSSL